MYTHTHTRTNELQFPGPKNGWFLCGQAPETSVVTEEAQVADILLPAVSIGSIGFSGILEIRSCRV